MSLRRIVYTGALSYFKYNTTISRECGLRDLGLDVFTLDTTRALGDNIWAARFNQRTYFGRAVRAMNAELIRFVREHRPDVVWLDKAMWAYPWTLRRLRDYAGFVVHYNTDDAFYRGGHFWLHRLGMRMHDLYLTTNRLNVREIRQRYGVRTLRVGMGHDSTHHRPPAPTDSPHVGRSGIVFAGHWERNTEEHIQALIDAGLPVKVGGNRWEHSRLGALRAVRFVPEDDYVATIARAEIALCILSRNNRNESTGRTFEIPAIGTFMLAERTPEHVYLFGEGVYAALFSGHEELVAKAKHYLMASDERRTIAAAGYARSQELGLSWEAHMAREWPIIDRLLTGRTDTVTPADDAPFWDGFRRGEPYRPKTTADG